MWWPVWEGDSHKRQFVEEIKKSDLDFKRTCPIISSKLKTNFLLLPLTEDKRNLRGDDNRQEDLAR